MTKLPELPEEIIGHILSFAPDHRDNLKKCHEKLLENKPIYYSTFEMEVYHERGEGELVLEDWLKNMRHESMIKYVNGRGRRVIWPYSIEISTPIKPRVMTPPLNSFRILKINYGWGREKDHESWKAVLKGEAGRKNLTTGYH